MYLKEMTLSGFRSYRERRFTFERRGAFFHGPNGSGKTNILEAIHHLAFAKSFRTTRSQDVIHWDAPRAEIAALFSDPAGLDSELLLSIDKKKRAAGSTARPCLCSPSCSDTFRLSNFYPRTTG
jgi:DNA replication and repair protein RecF